MEHTQSARTIGLGLAIYGLGNVVGFAASGSPGGNYANADVTHYISSDHFVTASACWYLVALSALGLVVAASALEHRLAAALMRLGAGCAVVGAFVSGGLAVAMREGGASVRTGVPHPVVYAITEIGNLVAVCAPALFVGAAALLLAAAGVMPRGLSWVTVVAGLFGILAPFFFTYFAFILWALVTGVVWAVRGRRGPGTTSRPDGEFVSGGRDTAAATLD